MKYKYVEARLADGQIRQDFIAVKNNDELMPHIIEKYGSGTRMKVIRDLWPTAEESCAEEFDPELSTPTRAPVALREIFKQFKEEGRRLFDSLESRQDSLLVDDKRPAVLERMEGAYSDDEVVCSIDDVRELMIHALNEGQRQKFAEQAETIGAMN